MFQRLRALRTVRILLGLLLVAVGTAEGQAQSALARAKEAYNAAQYDVAIAAAAEARQDPRVADVAAVVLARAYVERRRAGGVVEDIAAAREALRGVVPARLQPRDRVDWMVAVGQTLYAAGMPGAAAEVFDSAWASAPMLTADERAQLLDWWASALAESAEQQETAGRVDAFVRIGLRVEAALGDDPASGPANYWLAAALRGVGDLDRAWAAAIAGWIRVAGDPVAAIVRPQLDRLVVDALIPERAQRRPAADRADAETALRSEWSTITSGW
ncbi:MAG: hypothetical protein FJW23_03705 [Acidimicrobiia bacterium]|nr:hypothetical protein [Acidimicrobiia bacterium]